MIVTNTHRKAVELAKRRIVGHGQAREQAPCREHHTQPNGWRLKPADIERREYLRHLVIALVGFSKRAVEQLHQHMVGLYENPRDVELAIISFARLELRENIAVFRSLG